MPASSISGENVKNFRISDDHAASYSEKMPPWGFNGLGYVTYKRTYARPFFDLESDSIVRTEEWHETVQRVVNGAQDIGARLTEDEANRLYDYIFNLRGCVAGRMLWQLGTDNNKRLGGDSLVNCWFVDVQKPSDFSWSVERLMLGGGVGFSCNAPCSFNNSWNMYLGKSSVSLGTGFGTYLGESAIIFLPTLHIPYHNH